MAYRSRLSPGCVDYCDILLALNLPRTCELQLGVRGVVTWLQLHHRRGCRAGNHNLRHLCGVHKTVLFGGSSGVQYHRVNTFVRVRVWVRCSVWDIEHVEA